MASSKEDVIADDIEVRLDDIFGEDDVFSKEEPGDKKDSPLRELKTIVLSMDWEITDEVMTRFVEQINALKETFAKDKILIVFLQLLGSLGEYIRINKGSSLPDAFKLISSLFVKMEKVHQAQDLSESEKKNILAQEVNKYKALKKRLEPAKPEKEISQTKVSTQASQSVAADVKSLDDALAEIKQLIRSEIKQLREEIKLMRKMIAKRSA